MGDGDGHHGRLASARRIEAGRRAGREPKLLSVVARGHAGVLAEHRRQVLGAGEAAAAGYLGHAQLGGGQPILGPAPDCPGPWPMAAR